MSIKSMASFMAAFLLFTGALSNGQEASLADQLKALYPTSRIRLSAGQVVVQQAGIVLVLQKDVSSGVPPETLVTPAATYKDGVLKAPNSFALGLVAKKVRLLHSGEKVYVLGLETSLKSDKVILNIVECDSCNNMQQTSSYKAAVAFQFPKEYLSKADVSQIKDVISEVLMPETTQSGQAQIQNDHSAEATNQPQTQSTAPQDVLQNQDIIDLVKAGFDDATILVKIENSKCQFDTSTNALIHLKENNVSAAVIKAMVAKSSGK